MNADRLIHMVSSILLGLCPWLNVIIVFCRGIRNDNNKQIAGGLFGILIEMGLMVAILAIPADSQVMIPLFILTGIVIIIASLYTTFIFIKDPELRTIDYLLSAVLIGVYLFIFSLTPILVILIFYFVFKGIFKHKYFIAVFLSYAFLIIYSNSESHIDIQLLKMFEILILGVLVYWFFNCFDLYLLKKNTLASNLAPTNSNQNSRSNRNKPRKNRKPQEIPVEKGWVTDNTSKLQVNILTIEDIINPIALCNDHERKVKLTIIFLRKYANGSDERQLFGEQGIISYMDTLFRDLRIEAVRSIYIKSLYIMLTDFSLRDKRLKPYLNKFKKIASL